MSPRTVLPLSNPALRAALRDLKLLGHWEHLRRTRRVMTTAEFATACGIDLSAAQSGLDLLVESGLVVTLRATKSRKGIAYRAVANEVLISYSLDSQEQKEAAHAYMCIFSDESRAILDRHIPLVRQSGERRPYFHGFGSVMLTDEEYAHIQRLLSTAFESLIAADIRAEERACGIYSGEIAADSERPYHLALELRPLAYPEPPTPALCFWDERSVPQEIGRDENSPRNQLSKREFEIATLLASGESRPEIAKALGLSMNTIATVCKRIHAKLGIHSRAELTAKLKGV
jgi:DNA-binding CsgD family transcriptional regulator